MDDSWNLLCHVCSQPATLGCLCETPPVTICSDHLGYHIQKPTSKGHQMKALNILFPAPQMPVDPPPAIVPPVPLPNPAIPPELVAMQQHPGAPLLPPVLPSPPPKVPGPKPLPMEEIKEELKSSKKSKKKPPSSIKSQPISPKGLKTPAKADLFPDKSQPPSPKRLKDPCTACNQAECSLLLVYQETPLKKVCDACAKDFPDTLPLSTYPKLMENTDQIDFALEKFNYMKKIKTKLHTNLTRIDEFRKKVDKEFENILKNVQSCKTRILDEVAKHRSDIESKLNAALVEIEANLADYSYKPKTDFELVLWEKRVEDVNFDLFVSRCGPPDIIGEVTRAIDYEIQGLLLMNCIPVVRGTTLMRFGCKQGQWRETREIEGLAVSKHSIMTYLNDQNIMFTGDSVDPASNMAFIVSLATLEVRPIPDMTTPRFHHGSLCLGRNVYLFGGRNPDYLVSSEKFCLDFNKWSDLRDMLTPRACFNPFCYGKLIYIMGGMETKECELYDFVRDTYLPLSFFVPEEQPTTAVYLDPNIYILQGKKGLKWNPSHKSTKSIPFDRDIPAYISAFSDSDSESENFDSKGPKAWSNFTPLVVAGQLYLLSSLRNEVVKQELGGRFGVKTYVVPK